MKTKTLTPSPRPRRGRPAGRTDIRTSARIKRRGTLAAAAVAGTPLAQVAREEGVSRSWASREAHAPGTQVLIAELLDEHHERVRGLVARSLEVIAEALEADRTASVRVVTKSGKETINEENLVINLGPDHFARLTAVKRLAEICTAGRVNAEPGDGLSRPGVTMDMLLAVRQRMVTA